MKKLLTLLLSLVLFTASMTGTVTAASETPVPGYLSVTGVVVSVVEGKISVEDENGNPALLVVTDKTVYPFKSEVSVGDVVTGFYLADAPMIMIWPPQYNISVLSAGAPEGSNIKVDRFHVWEDNAEGYLLAQGGAFAFKTDEKTETVLADGKDFSGGAVEGRRLVVIYDISTRSIPELTTAKKVIVLFEDAVALPGAVPETVINVAEWPVMVNGVKIDAPAAFQTGDGIVMAPLRAISEALGYKVEWSHKTYSVTLDGTIKLTIGEAAVAGEPAPVIVNDFTYVSLAFFSDILKTGAYASEGQIKIDSSGSF